MVQELTIEDLSRQSGLSLRTLRYYIQEGLLPGPDTAGKYASYSQQHLDYLMLIKRLKRLRLPLKEIRHLLSNMSFEDMHRILGYQDAIQTNIQEGDADYKTSNRNLNKKNSALDYIRELEQRQSNFRSLAGSPNIPASPQINQSSSEINQSKRISRINQTKKERWTKIIIQEGIELNVKEDAAGKFRREIDELISIAAKLFGNE